MMDEATGHREGLRVELRSCGHRITAESLQDTDIEGRNSPQEDELRRLQLLRRFGLLNNRVRILYCD
jgi:hypothetical protein